MILDALIINNNDEAILNDIENEIYSAVGLSPDYFSSDTDKHCPYCGRSILPNATMCGFCAFLWTNAEIIRGGK